MDESSQADSVGKLCMFGSNHKSSGQHMLTLILVVFVYGILFMDWGEMAGREVAPFASVCVAMIGMFISALLM